MTYNAGYQSLPVLLQCLDHNSTTNLNFRRSRMLLRWEGAIAEPCATPGGGSCETPLSLFNTRKEETGTNSKERGGALCHLALGPKGGFHKDKRRLAVNYSRMIKFPEPGFYWWEELDPSQVSQGITELNGCVPDLEMFPR